MAQVHQKNDLFVVQYVTGPQHVWLAVKFSCDKHNPTVVKRPPIGGCSHGEIDEQRVVESVTAAAEEHGLYAERVEYVANDSPNYEIYAHCARSLAKHASSRMAADSSPHLP
jgi:hypothetical protein